MPDGASELREMIMALVDHQVNAMNVDQGIAFAPGTAVAGNPFGALNDEGQEVQYGTGFDGTNTLVPFVLDISSLSPGGSDVLI